MRYTELGYNYRFARMDRPLRGRLSRLSLSTKSIRIALRSGRGPAPAGPVIPNIPNTNQIGSLRDPDAGFKGRRAPSISLIPYPKVVYDYPNYPINLYLKGSLRDPDAGFKGRRAPSISLIPLS
jgi:hypothetical protein